MIAEWIAGALGALAIAFAWWRFHFFHRNPPRVPPPGDTLVCPADGRLLSIEDVDLSTSPLAYHGRVRAAFGVEGHYTVAATYLSIWDVHFVRAPLGGRARLRPIAALGGNVSMGASYVYTMLRRPLPTSKTGYRDKNEFLGVEIGGVLLVLMADWWIDQIVCYVADGDVVERGQVIAKILMGSQVDLFAPAEAYDIQGRPGDRVRASQMVIAERRASRVPLV